MTKYVRIPRYDNELFFIEDGEIYSVAREKSDAQYWRVTDVCRYEGKEPINLEFLIRMLKDYNRDKTHLGRAFKQLMMETYEDELKYYGYAESQYG